MVLLPRFVIRLYGGMSPMVDWRWVGLLFGGDRSRLSNLLLLEVFVIEELHLLFLSCKGLVLFASQFVRP